MTRIVYHGSREPYIDEIRGGMPPYAGSIGAGVYVSFDPQVARFYGPHVYAFELLLDDDDILWITPDFYSLVEGFEGHSVLVGENVPPFSFRIGDQKHTVGWDEMVDSIVEQRVHQRLMSLVGKAAAHDLTRGGDRVPDEYDVKEWVDELDRVDVGTKLMGAGVDISGMSTDERYDALYELVYDPIFDAIAEEKERAAQELGLVIDLEDVGGEARAAGYKGVALEGVRSGFPNEELLVFDASDIKMIGPVDADRVERNPKIVGGVYAYAAAGLMPNGDVVEMPEAPPRMDIGSRSYALSDIGMGAPTQSAIEQGGARVISGGGTPWRYIWVLEPDSGQLDSYRHSDGEWKVLGQAKDYPGTVQRLRQARQLNIVTPEELAEFEAEMRARNEDALEAAQRIWESMKSGEQHKVEAIVKAYWDEKVQPMVDQLWVAIDSGVEPIGFEYDADFEQRTGKDWQAQAKMYAFFLAVRRAGFKPYESPLEDYVVSRMGLSDVGELEDIQAIDFAHGDVLDVALRRATSRT